MTKAIENTKHLSENNLNLLIHLNHLSDQNNEEGLPDRTNDFIKFHQYIYSLPDSDIYNLMKAIKKFTFDEKLSEDKSTYCDYQLMRATIDFQYCLRDEKSFCPVTCDEIARDYKRYQVISKKFPEVTSEVLIEFAENLLNKYTRKH